MKESYYMRNRERKLAYQREYYQAHRAECLERIKASTKRRSERERRRVAKIKIKIDMDEDKKLCALCRRYNPISYKGEDTTRNIRSISKSTKNYIENYEEILHRL